MNVLIIPSFSLESVIVHVQTLLFCIQFFVIQIYVTVKIMFKQILYVLFTFGRNGNGKLYWGF